jgi:hypothetical protein
MTDRGPAVGAVGARRETQMTVDEAHRLRVEDASVSN